MSTATTAQDITALDNGLNQRVIAGDILGAFDAYYGDGVVMQENSAEPTTGKAANRKREEEFVASVEQLHSVQLIGSAVNGNRSYSEWLFDATYKGGVRIALTQVAVRQWLNGKVVHERFYYNKG